MLDALGSGAPGRRRGAPSRPTWTMSRAAPILAAGVVAILLGGVSVLAPLAALLAALGLVAAGAVAVAGLRASTALLVVMPLAIAFGTIQFGPVPSNSALALAAIVILGATVSARASRFRWTPPLAVAFGYVLWAVASGWWSSSFDETLVLWIGLAVSLTFLAVVVVLVESERALAVLVAAIAVAAGLAGLIGLFVTPVDSLATSGQVGILGDRNFFATFQVVAIPLVVALAVHQRGIRRLALALASIVAGAAVIVSTSRSGLIALAVVIVGMALIPTGSLFPSSRARAGFVTLALVVGGAALIAVGGQSLERFGATDEVDSGRGNLWIASRQAFGDEPALGVGFGAFRSESAARQLADPRTDLVNNDLLVGQASHNTYLGSAAELGVPGVILLAALLLVTAAAVRTAYRRHPPASLARAASGALLVSMAGWVTMSLFLSLEAARVTWLIIGLASALYAMSPARTSPRDRAPASRPPDPVASAA